MRQVRCIVKHFVELFQKNFQVRLTTVFAVYWCSLVGDLQLLGETSGLSQKRNTCQTYL